MDAIHLNNFSLEIMDNNGPVEKVIYKDSNYYAMPEGTEYKLRLTNSRDTRTDAHVWIDGEKVGIWRINPNSRIVVERPSGTSRKFMILNNRIIDSPNIGVVKVTFKPEMYDNLYGLMRHGHEKEYLYSAYTPRCFEYSDTVTPYDKQHQNCMLSTKEYEDKLYGKLYSTKYNSKQNFDHVTPLSDIDYNNITTIYTRLVVDNDRSTYSRKYNTLREARNVSSPPQRLDLQHPSRAHPCSRDSSFKLSRKYHFDNF